MPFFPESQSIKGNKSRRVHCGKEISRCYNLAMHFPMSVTSAGNSYNHAGNWGSGKCTCSWALAGVWKFQQDGKTLHITLLNCLCPPPPPFFFLKGILIILFSLNVFSTPGVNSGPKWLASRKTSSLKLSGNAVQQKYRISHGKLSLLF